MSRVHVIKVSDVSRLTNSRADRIEYIGRGSRLSLGNPFIVGLSGTREEAILKHDIWWRNQPHVIAALKELAAEQRDVYLVCHCAPERCHGDNYKAEIERIRREVK